MPVKLNPKSDSYEALMWDVITNAHKYLPRKGSTVLDLGAHCGFFSLYCAARGANVKAYEPNPELWPELVHAAAVAEDIGEGSISPVKEAIWSKECFLQLYERSDSSAALTVLGGSKPIWKTSATTLKNAMEWRIYDCVKVDIEGAEYEVFMHAEPDVFQNIGYLTIEIHNDLLRFEQRRELGEKLISSFPHHKIYPVKGTEDIATLVCWQ